jgi:hypothetical protein
MTNNKDGTNANDETANDSIQKDEDPEVLQHMMDSFINDLKFFNKELDQETDPHMPDHEFKDN